MRNPSPRRCTAICADGSPCRAWAVRTSHPPRCAAHGGGTNSVGAPPDNQNAITHGYYARPLPAKTLPEDTHPEECNIDTVIADLHEKQLRLSRYLDEHYEDLSPEQLARFHHIHAQGSSRLGRLLRDRAVLLPEMEDPMKEAINAALDALSEEWGVEL